MGHTVCTTKSTTKPITAQSDLCNSNKQYVLLLIEVKKKCLKMKMKGLK